MTEAELAILSLLVEQPRHGYELEQVIAERGMRDWTAVGFSSIYYLLGRLERGGLATSATDPAPGKGPTRRVYAATTAGREAWAHASLALLAAPTGGNRPFLLGLAAIPGLPLDHAAEALAAYRDALGAREAAIQDRRRAQAGAPWFVDALFDYSVRMLAAERDWVDRFGRSVARRAREEEAAMNPAKLKPFVPRIADLPARTVAVARTTGDPNEVGPRVFPALYGAVYPLKFARKKEGRDFRMEAPRARWFGGPDWATTPREAWSAAWALPVPEDTGDLAQKDPAIPVAVETWEYGTVAEVMHVGSYAEEVPTIEALHAYITDQGFEIAGPHEEEYLSRPGVKAPKTVIRYQVRRRA